MSGEEWRLRCMVKVECNKGYISINQYDGKMRRRTVSTMARGTNLMGLFMIALMFSSVFLMVVPYATAQVHVKPTLAISSLNPGSRDVVVTPSSIGAATFSATVTVTKLPAVGTVMVQLDGTTSTGWTTVVSPMTIPFTQGTDVQISVTVVVPQAAPTSSIGKVTINGLASWPGGTATAMTSGTVTVVQYYRIQPQAVQSFVTVPPGGQAVLTLELYNRGNGLDTIVIEITNLKDLAKKSWMVSATAYEVSNIVQDEYGTIRIFVRTQKPPYGIDHKMAEPNYIQLNVKSGNADIAGQSVIKTYVFAVVVDGWGLPGFDITFLIMAFAMVASYLAYHQKRQH
jgi:hypothetical protein